MMERSDTLNVLLVLGGLALVAILVVAVVYFVRLARLWALVRDPAMPAAGKVAFWAGLIYAVSPVDLLPDPIYLDDVGVLAAAAAFVLSTAKKAGLLDGGRLRTVGRAAEWATRQAARRGAEPAPQRRIDLDRPPQESRGRKGTERPPRRER